MSERIAVVTGAGSGIGLAIARELVARRFSLLACSRDQRELDGLASEAGDRLLARVGADLSTDEGVRALLDRVDVLDRAPDLLVNCAGLGSWGEHLSIESSKVRAMLAVNVHALTTITSHVTRAMVARGSGRVLQVASTAAFQPVPMFAVYAATKHYVRAFSEALHDELDGTGVTVTVLYPGVTKTPFLDAARFPLDGAPGSVGWIARKALLEPEDVARKGVEGALQGERRVVVGALNQLQRALGIALPDAATRALWRSFLGRK
jgi:short-subunit dehydrogenase